MIGFRPLLFLPLCYGEMRKGCRKTSSLNRLAEGLISSGKKGFALRAWRPFDLAQDMLGGRKSPKISSRKGFGREPQPNGAKHALSPSAKLRINSVEGFAKSGLAGEYSEDCRLMNPRR